MTPRALVAHLTPEGDLHPDREAGGTRIWPFTQAWWRPRRSSDPRLIDPVNLLILGAAPLEVWEALREQGWARPGDGAVHRTWIDGRARRMIDHIALGDRAERDHVRLFRLGGHTLAAAHHEVAGADGHHRVTSWNRARDEVIRALTRAAYVPLTPSAVIAAVDLRGAPGDGRAWRVAAPGHRG